MMFAAAHYPSVSKDQPVTWYLPNKKTKPKYTTGKKQQQKQILYDIDYFEHQVRIEIIVSMRFKTYTDDV